MKWNRASSRLQVFGRSLLVSGFPLAVFGYLVHWRRVWELATWILLASFLPLLAVRPAGDKGGGAGADDSD
jgi:hypothetical protein